MRSEALSAIGIALTPAMAFAAGSGEPHIGHLTWYFINFTIYVVGLTLLLKKPFGAFWGKRREEIEAAVNKGEQEMQAAKAALMEATEKASSLTPEYLEGVVTRIKEEAHAEAKKVMEGAEVSAQQIAKHAAQSIEGERVKNETAVRQEIAELVIAKATERIKNTYSEGIDKTRREVAVSGSAALVQ